MEVGSGHGEHIEKLFYTSYYVAAMVWNLDLSRGLKIMSITTRRILLPALVLLTFLAIVVTLSTSTVASTDVDSDITVNTEWVTAGSPYYVKMDVVVRDGVTLTIEPGVDVKFNGFFYLECAATGKIMAQGTVDKPINFTSNSATPVAGDWAWVTTGSGGELSYCYFAHASIAVKVDSGGTVSNCDIQASSTGILIESVGATVEDTYLWGLIVAIGIRDANNAVVQRCVVENCDDGINFLGTTSNSRIDECTINSSVNQGVGIIATGGNNKVWNCYIARSPIGILVRDLIAPTGMGGVHIFNCTIVEFSEKGIYLESVRPVNTVQVQRCKVWDGNYGIYIHESANFEITECTFRENIKGAKVINCTDYTSYIHKNNFIKSGLAEAESTNSEVLWDKNGFGNFWWLAIYQYGFQDNNGDGIADTVWSLTGTQKDNFPLMKPVDFETPVAEAGDDIKTRQHRTFDLDGEASTDDTWVANYTWTIDLPDDDIVVYGMKVERVKVDFAGIFTVTLRVADALGNHDTDTFQLNVTDADAPSFEAMNTPNRAGAGTLLTFSANITDNVEVEKAWVTYRFGPAGQNNRLDLVHMGNDVWENATFIPASINLKIYYSLTAKDAENNIQRSAEKEIIVADVSPPMISSALEDSVTTGEFNWINMTITDNRHVSTTICEYWFGEDGVHQTLNMSMMGVTWVTQIDVPRDAPTPLFLVFNATDLAGNFNLTDPIEVPVVDNDPPVVNIDMTTIHLHKGEQAEVRAIINDNIGIESAFVEVRYPPDTEYEATPLAFDGTEWVGTITVKSTGVRIHYHFRVTDTSGNTVVTEDTERLMLSQRPEIVTVPDAEAWEGQEYLVDFEAEDPDNQPYEHQWKMDTNASWLELDVVEGIVSGTPDDVHVGWFWVNITVLDPDGVDDWLLFEIVVHDVNAPPEVSIVSPVDEQKIGTILKVTGRASDDLDDVVWVQVRIDDGPWEDVVGTKTWSYETSIKDLKPGMHFIDAKSYDGISESKVIEVAFIVPKKDEPDDSPGYGGVFAAIALVSALVAVTALRGKRL